MDPQLAFEVRGGSTKYEVDVVGTPFKIELFRLSAAPFDQSRFARRIRVRLLEREAWLPTPEDVILQKLAWNRPKDREDVLGVIIAHRGTLDRDYLVRWCEELDVLALFDELWSECQSFGDE